MRTLIIVAGFIALIAGLFALSAWVFMFLWNFIAPTFGLPHIGFWVSAAIVLLLSFVGGAIKSSSK